jgi:hypothetical protein
MKDANLKAEIQEDENGITVTFKLIKKYKNFPEQYLKVRITPEKIIADLTELNCFCLEKFSPEQFEIEIAN